VGLPVVVLLPVGAGVVGGVLARWARAGSRSRGRRPRLGRLDGPLVLVLAGTILVAAVAGDPALGLTGAIGAVGAVGLAKRHGLPGDSPHADLTLVGLCGHRVLEGLAIASLYSAGAAVGLVGVVVVAGHSALETAVVGGWPSSSRGRAIVGSGLVQLAYLGGAGLGIVVGETLPTTVRIPTMGLLGGVLVLVGLGETTAGSASDHAIGSASDHAIGSAPDHANDVRFGRVSAPAADRDEPDT